MASISEATISQLYSTSAALAAADLAVEAYKLVRNQARVLSTDAAMLAAYSDLKSYIVPATSATVSNGETAAIASSDGVTRTTGTYRVASGIATGVVMPVGYAVAVDNASLPVANSQGTIVDSLGSAKVVAGALSRVQLGPSKALVSSDNAISVPVTGTYVSKITPKVSNGVLTSFVLS